MSLSRVAFLVAKTNEGCSTGRVAHSISRAGYYGDDLLNPTRLDLTREVSTRPHPCEVWKAS